MDLHELKSNLHLLEIPLADLGCVSQLPGHVRAKWASQASEAERSGSLQSIEEKLGRAERKREEFRSWVTDKARTRPKVSQTTDERRAKHLQRLQDRLVLAEANRLSTLEAVKLKAAAEQVKLEEVVSKLNERLERKAQKIEEGLKAAERRRQALMEAEKERLTAAHELVLARLVFAQEREKQDLSARHRAIESRLQQAGEMRHAQLAERAARASEKVARAKHVSSLTRRQAQQDAQQKITNWRAKLEGAAERRQSHQKEFRSPDLHGTSQKRPRSMRAQPGLSDAERERLSVIHHSMRARHVQNMWRSFVKRRKTTAALANAFVMTGVTGLHSAESPARPAGRFTSNPASPTPVIIGAISGGTSPAHAPFEEFAKKLQAANTLKLAQALLRRLEVRLQARGTADKSCSALLRRLFPRAPRNSSIERYPTRVFLCAYMVIRHPEIIFNSIGERERSLSAAAKDLLLAFELLLQRILEPPPAPLPESSPHNSCSATPDNATPSGSLTGSPTSRSLTGTPVNESPAGTPTHRSPPVSLHGSPIHTATGSPASSEPPSQLESPRSLSSPTAGMKIKHGMVPPSPLKEGMQAYRAAMKLKLSKEASKLGNEASGKGERLEEPLDKSAGEKGMNYITIGELLVQFDEAWLSYLDQFVAWKSADAVSLEQELIRMAVRLETSVRRKVGVGSGQQEFDRRVAGSKDLQAMVAQVKYDHQLLRERIGKLGGEAGFLRLEAALDAGRGASDAGASTSAASDSQLGSDADSTTSSRRNSHNGEFESEWETDLASTPTSRRPSVSGLGLSTSMPPPGELSPDTLQQLVQTQDAMLAAAAARQTDRPPRPAAGAGTAATPASTQRRSAADGAGAASSPLSAGIREWSAMHTAGLTNEQMVWELVYNPEFQLPQSDAEAAWAASVSAAVSAAPSRSEPASPHAGNSPPSLAELRARARQAAERAFWDSVQLSLTQGLLHGSGPAAAARLLSELASTLVELVADPNRATIIQQQYAESELSQQLHATKGVSNVVVGGLDVERLLSVLDSLGRWLSVLGAPSQEGEVRAAHARMAEQLGEAVMGGVDGQEGAEKLAKVVCRALRLMWSQLSLMKIQAANARLRGVAVALQGVGAVRYLRDKFRRSHQLPVAAPAAPDPSGEEPIEGLLTPPMLERHLPRTCSWFNSTREVVQPVLQRLQAASLQLPSATLLSSWLSSFSAAPLRMASGRGPVGRSTAGVWQENTAPAINPILPVQPLSWRGRVRCGLVSLLSSSTPAASNSTPEILQWDAVRLHEAQNRYQQLLVCTASLLIVQQVRAGKALPPWTASEQQEAKLKLLLTLEDPAMKLPDLITLLSQLAQSSSAPDEAQIRTAFTRIIDPSSNAFQVMGLSLSVCLSLLVICGPSLLELATGSGLADKERSLGYASPVGSPGGRERDFGGARSAPPEVLHFAVGLRGLLAKGGALVLAPELTTLATSILTMAAVSEAVHKDVFTTLSDEI